MKDKTYPQRKRLRKLGFDYSRGIFFVSQVTKHRQLLFGSIKDRSLFNNEQGEMVEKWWLELRKKFSHVQLDEYIVMPDHFQGILILGYKTAEDAISDKFYSHSSTEDLLCLSSVMQWFKTMTTNEYIREVRLENWLPFENKVWQRSFHDVIIKDVEHLRNVRNYIRNNPKHWTPHREEMYYNNPT